MATTLVTNFIARTDSFQRGVQKNITSLNRFSGSIANSQKTLVLWGKALAGAYAIRGMVRAGKELVRVASTAEETQSKFNTVFRGMADDANKWAVDFGKSVGRANVDVKKWMAQLQDTFVPLGFARDKAFELSKELVTLGVDVASFNDVADTDVISNFTSALVGSARAVMNYGIVIQEATIKEEMLRQGMKKKYSQLTTVEKALLRYKLMLRSTSDAQGDAVRTMGSYANQAKALTSNLTNIKEALGNSLLPVATEATKALNEYLRGLEDLESKSTKVLRNIAMGGAYVVEVFKAIHAVIKGLSAGVLGLGSITLGVFAKMAKAAEGLQHNIADLINSIIDFQNKFAETWGSKKLGIEPIELRMPKADYSGTLEAMAKALREVRDKLKSEAETALLDLTNQTAVKNVIKFFDKIANRTKEIAAMADRAAGGEDVPVIDTDEIKKQVAEYIKSVRAMHYKTRMERIAQLKQYAAEHKEILDQVLEKENILTDEIKALTDSRLDAWRVYMMELREDAEDFSLVIADNMVSAADSIEDSMANAFGSIMEDARNWRDTLTNFALDIQQAFQQMVSRIIARAVMTKIAGALGGIFGMAGGGDAGLGAVSTSAMAASNSLNTLTVAAHQAAVSLGASGGGAAGGIMGVPVAGGKSGGILGGIGNMFSGMVSGAGGFLSGAVSGLMGAIGGLFSPINSATGSVAMMPGLYAHSGGIVGELNNYKMVPASVFTGAPRYHTGLLSDEIGAILKKKELVLNEQQQGQLVDAFNSKSSGGNVNVNFNVSAIDAAGVGQFFGRNSKMIASAVKKAMDGGHPLRKYDDWG